MNVQWNGIYPAITTQFNEKDQIDFDAMAKSLHAQVEAGVDGMILGGTLGEASTLSAEEKSELLKFTINEIGDRVPVILNIAEQSTKMAIETAIYAADSGADGLMLLPPMRYSADDEEVVTYMKAVAEATELPIVLYNNPIDYKTFISLDMFRQFEDVETIKAVKESTRDVSNVIRIKNAFGDRFKVLTGVDTLGMESLVVGADGWIAGLVCAFPKETVAIYRLIKAKRYDEALSIYRWFLPLLELDINPQLVQNIKLAAQYTDLGFEHVRAPRLPLRGVERERVINIIESALRNRPNLPDYLNLTTQES